MSKVNIWAAADGSLQGEVDKKDDSGNETGAGEAELEEHDVIAGYDKKKSFFDNISCEAVERWLTLVNMNRTTHSWLSVWIVKLRQLRGAQL